MSYTRKGIAGPRLSVRQNPDLSRWPYDGSPVRLNVLTEDRDTLRRKHLSWIHAFDSGGDVQLELTREQFVRLLNEGEAPFDRSCFVPGHITASGVVLDPTQKRCLLVHHPFLHRWLQPGGHFEPGDQDAAAAARREIVEETGVALMETSRCPLVGLDIHTIPEKGEVPSHLHYDMTFLFSAASAELNPTHEVTRVAWCAVDDLMRYQADKPLQRSVGRAIGSVTPTSPS